MNMELARMYYLCIDWSSQLDECYFYGSNDNKLGRMNLSTGTASIISGAPAAAGVSETRIRGMEYHRAVDRLFMVGSSRRRLIELNKTTGVGTSPWASQLRPDSRK